MDKVISCNLEIVAIQSYLYRYISGSMECVYNIGIMKKTFGKNAEGFLLFSFQNLNEALGCQKLPEFVLFQDLPAIIKQTYSRQIKNGKISLNPFQNDENDEKYYTLPVIAHLRKEDICSHFLYSKLLKL